MSDRNALALELAGTPAVSHRDALAEELSARWDQAVQAQQPLTPAPPVDVGTDPATWSRRRTPDDLDAGIDRTLQPTAMGTKQLGATALVTGGTMAGAALGGMTGPLAPVAVPVLSALGGEAGNMTSKYLGWQPGQWNEPDLSDALAVGVPLVAGGGTAVARAALPYTRAGRAVQNAKDATAVKAAQHAGWLAEAEAAHAEAVAAAQAARKPWESRWNVTDPPVPPELARLRATPPTPVEPGPAPSLKSMGLHLLSELGGGGGLSYLFGGSKIPAYIGGAVATVDTADALVSKALLSPRIRPWLLRQLEASGGTLTPQTLATLSAVVRGGALPSEAEER